MTEQWKIIIGFDDYLVSNFGTVFSISKNKFYKPGDNYHYVSLKNSVGERKNYAVHKLVAEAFIPNPNSYKIVNHIDGVKCNNRADNLEWCTYSMNVKHAYEIGLATPTIGEKHGMSKLKENQILEIRELAKSGVYNTEISAQYNISETTINRILRGATWKHKTFIENTSTFKRKIRGRLVVNLHTGIFYVSAVEAAESLNCIASTLRNKLSGHRKNDTDLIYI